MSIFTSGIFGGGLANRVEYSTEEQVVGTWMDGRPLYQKTVSVAIVAPSSDGVDAKATVELDSLIDTVWEFNGVTNASGTTMEMPFVSLRSSTKVDYVAATVRFIPTTHLLEVHCHMLGSNHGTVYCTIRYTKSTDLQG